MEEGCSAALAKPETALGKATLGAVQMPRYGIPALARVTPPVGLLKWGSILPGGCQTQAADVAMWLLPQRRDTQTVLLTQ